MKGYDFTNMMWKETVEVGFGIAGKEGEDWYVVAKYCGRGNEPETQRTFALNVLPTGGYS